MTRLTKGIKHIQLVYWGKGCTYVYSWGIITNRLDECVNFQVKVSNKKTTQKEESKKLKEHKIKMRHMTSFSARLSCWGCCDLLLWWLKFLCLRSALWWGRNWLTRTQIAGRTACWPLGLSPQTRKVWCRHPRPTVRFNRVLKEKKKFKHATSQYLTDRQAVNVHLPPVCLHLPSPSSFSHYKGIYRLSVSGPLFQYGPAAL